MALARPQGMDQGLRAKNGRVAFFGCPELANRGEYPIVRVAEREGANGKPKQVLHDISCVCETTHPSVSLMWRGLKDDEEPNPDIWI